MGNHDESLGCVTIGLARPGFQMMRRKGAERRIDPIDVRERVRGNPCLLEQPGTVRSLVSGRELPACQRTGHGMRKRLDTHLTGYRSLSIIEGVVRGQAAVEIRPVDHPAIERVRLPSRLGWRRKSVEAFGGKCTLTGSGPAGETPSAGSINANDSSLEFSAPRGNFYWKECGEFLAVLPGLEGDGMKALLEPADIHTDDDETRPALIHTDLRTRKDSRYLSWSLVLYLE